MTTHTAANSADGSPKHDEAEGPDFLAGYSAVSDSSHHHVGHGPSTFRRLLTILEPEAAEIRMILLFSVAVGLLALATPIAVEALVNSVAFGGLIQPVVVLSLMLFACLATAALISALEYYVVELIQRRMFVRAAARATAALSRTATIDDPHQMSPAILTNRFLEVAQIQKVTAMLLLDVVTIVLITTIGMIVLAFYHPVLLAFDIGLTVAIIIMVFGLARNGVTTSVEESLAKHGLVRWLEQLAQRGTTFRSREGAQLATDVSAALTMKYLANRAVHFRTVYRQLNFGLGLQVVASVILLGLGGKLVIDGQMTLGQLVAAELIMTLITGQLARLGKYVESYYDLAASIDKLETLLDIPVERTGGEQPAGEPGRAALRVRNVSFRFGTDYLLFRGVTFEAAPGSAVAIMGGEGSGKSVLASLIVGAREASSGVVELDGVDLRRWDLPTLRDRVALVQSEGIVEATIVENVRLARERVDVDAVRRALTAVELLDEVAILPHGIDATLALDGFPLSRGQMRRLLLARALAGGPGMLLLDGILDNIEPVRRRRIWNNVRRKYPSTIVVLTSDPETAGLCDAIIDLDRRDPQEDDADPSDDAADTSDN